MTSIKYEIAMSQTPADIRIVTVEAEDAVLIAVVQANEKQPSAYMTSALEDVVSEAATGVRPVSSRSAELFAERVGVAILRSARLRRDVGAVEYAGAVVAADATNVCTAGSLRVHLIEGSVVRRVTRDHNPVHDNANGTYAGVDERLDFFRDVITRALPATDRPVECVEWPVAPGAKIAIVSARCHRHREPATYLQSMLEPATLKDGFVALVTHRIE